ncbi:uncharacterized protein PAN0_009c3895 [Moesziomyces antarcticus]|uniref:Uncharacterized protein n=2 Tax=Pseudozyma antarctica TaxID=84753 RepID=A0A081CG81_PSEA2|nr:uncharacterized protein PAN0_009c3895 [Moesziomyces antarcticus]GAK65677.1 hypothetical protein PAN0_009c3895 [Moesziomyces antarcticus]SPO46697.1 uncharacterized protein PSANT_04383 [Moesziomyces antarcticus]
MNSLDRFIFVRSFVRSLARLDLGSRTSCSSSGPAPAAAAHIHIMATPTLPHGAYDRRLVCSSRSASNSVGLLSPASNGGRLLHPSPLQDPARMVLHLLQAKRDASAA